MSKIIYVTTEALKLALNKDYGMKLPKDTKFVLTSESDKEREQNYVADLEAKLEQYEKFMKDNEWDSIEEMQTTLNECEKKYFDMQQQLEQVEHEKALDNTFWKQECDSLKKALAEKEKLIKFYINSGKEQCDEINKINHRSIIKSDEIDQLKQQLAEKEKEIDHLQDKLHHYYEEVMNKGTCGLCEHLRGEYKTDFAIEQLKQTKKLIKEKYTYDVEESDWAVVYELDIDEIFDKQIKELKEGK